MPDAVSIWHGCVCVSVSVSVSVTPTSRAATTAAEQPLGPAIPQPTFNPIASNTTFGPLTDILMGWDGTLWGIDAQGAPHVYDAIGDTWAQHGEGIDAAAVTQSGTLFIFRGSDVMAVNPVTLQASAPTPIAQQWPTLPDSFKLGVVGAATSPLSDDGLLKYPGSAFGNWPTTWHPTLQHAPNGRDGNLWSVLLQSQGGWVIQHNGDAWTALPNQADHAGVGQDNTVMIASAQKLWKFNANSDTAFAGGIIGTLPGMINPLKFVPSLDIAALIVAAVDTVTGFASCAVTLWGAFAEPQALPPRRLFFPFVPHAPRPVQAHPLALGGATP